MIQNSSARLVDTVVEITAVKQRERKKNKMTSKLRSEGVTQNDKGIVFWNERIRFYKGFQ